MLKSAAAEANKSAADEMLSAAAEANKSAADEMLSAAAEAKFPFLNRAIKKKEFCCKSFMFTRSARILE